MNCNECREQLVAYIEGLLDDATDEIKSHLSKCPDCQRELKELQQLRERLVRDGRTGVSVSLVGPVTDRIIQEQALKLRRIQMRKRYRFFGPGLAAAAAIALFVFFSLSPARPNGWAKAAEVLAKGADAASNLRSIHIKCRMRTLPADNFSQIGPQYDFVPVELWKQFGEQTRWRIEKPGRVVVMDGESTVMYIKGHLAVKAPPSKAAFDTGWLHRWAAVDKILTNELRSALAKGWELKLTHERTDDGVRKQVVAIEAKAPVDNDDYLKNKFLMTSDNRRVYRFDAKSGRLEDAKVYLHTDKGDVLIIEVTRIEYDSPIDPTIFTLELPKDVVWYKPPQRLADNEKYERMTPKEAARVFFEACSKEDWDEASKFCSFINDRFKKGFGGLKIIRIGEPFQSKSYPGWFVPYEIKFKSGGVKKLNLALKKHKHTKRYFVDGGI